MCYPAVLTEYDLDPPLSPSLSAHHLPICEMRHLFAFGVGSEILGGVFSLLCISIAISISIMGLWGLVVSNGI